MAVASDRGFTLIELMISLAIFSIVSMAAFSVLSASQKASVMNDQSVQIQKNVRLALDLIARDIRMAGFANPVLPIVLPGCAQQFNATDNNAAGNDTGPDTISVMGIDQQIGTLGASFTGGSSITVSNLISGVAAGDVISLEGVFNASVNSVSGNTLNLSQGIVGSNIFPQGAAVIRLACITYTVAGANGVVPGGTATVAPYTLLRNTTNTPNNAVPIVDGIEDLQLAYAIDANADGVIDDQAGGTAGVVDCLDFIPNNLTCTQGTTIMGPGTALSLPLSINTTPTSVRQVRITVVGRAIPPQAGNVVNNCWYDTEFQITGQLSVVQAEDHLLAAPVQPATCKAPLVTGGIRRRSLTRVVTLRNVSIS